MINTAYKVVSASLMIVALCVQLSAQGQEVKRQRSTPESPESVLNAPIWHEYDRPVLNKAPADAVAALVYKVISEGSDTPQKAVFTAAGPQQFLLDQFTFTDLDADGQLELVASVDTQGRPFFNTVVIVSHKQQGFQSDMIESWGPHNFQNEIVRLGTGHSKQVITRVVELYPPPEVPSELTDEAGISVLPQAAWVNIYEWKDGKAAEVNRQFASYYEKQYIPRMEQAAQRIENASGLTGEQKDVLASEYQVGSYRARQIMGQQDAGLFEAERWMSSGNSVLRTNAARVLADINTPAANAELERIAAGGDLAANRAKATLERRRNR